MAVFSSFVKFLGTYTLTLTREEKAAIEQMRNSDSFKGDAATKRSIFQKFKNYFS